MPLQELMKNRRVVCVGSRTSELALKQTKLIIDRLSQVHCDINFKIVTMETIGDKVLDKELSKIGDKSLFTKELEIALLNKNVDFVVHSLKDVPTYLASEFALGCICLRDSVEDAVVMKQDSFYTNLDELPQDSVVGTSSVRRIAQLKRKYPHLKFSSVRGNLNTRLKKLDSDSTIEVSGSGDVPAYSALILAKAGLERIGLKRRISQVLSSDNSLYAVGQGALACECRSDDMSTLKLLASIHDDESGVTSISERSLMRQLDGGCSTPIAVRSTLSKDGLLTLKAAVMSVDGSECIQDECCAFLPDEDVETFLDGIHNEDDDNSDDDMPMKKRIKLDNPNYCVVTDRDVQLGKDPKATFLGLRVSPICEIGRLRMAISENVGAVLAKKLLAAGAKQILDGIKRTQGEVESIAKNSDSKQFF